MRDKRDHARGWFRKAESDLHTAQRALDSDGPYDTACFHAQQVAEKYLKGRWRLWNSLFLAPTTWKSCSDSAYRLCLF